MPKSSPKFKSQFKSQIQVQRKGTGTGTGADTIILQATTPPPPPTNNFSHLKCQSSDRKGLSMTFHDLPWPSLTFYELLLPYRLQV